MDPRLYDTSLTLYAITDSSLPYRNLLQAHQGALQARATKLQEYLVTNRRRYEDEEEKEKIGSLKECTWASFHNPQHHRRRDADGIAIVLIYDKAIYKFLLYSNSSISRGHRAGNTDLPLLLAKASAALTKRFLSFLAETFHVGVSPLRLPTTFLATIISSYVSTVHSCFASVSGTTGMLGLLKEALGTLKLGITVNAGSVDGDDISKHLRSIDVDVPAETLYQLLTSPPPQASSGFKQAGFLPSLQNHIHNRTGLILPLLAQNSGIDDTNEPPLKLSRISNTSFALSTEGRIKFSSKAFEAVEAIPGLESGDENVVKKANTQLLEAIVAEALKNR